MQTSDQIGELAKALAKAQRAIKNALKDSTNPHFKSRYADLASVWDAIREPLTSNGLSVVQTPSSVENKVQCTTMLLHESGQFVRDTMSMTPTQNTPQAQGSCLTYLRRYMLQSVAGVAPDDDDGNEASKRGMNDDKKKLDNQTDKSPVDTSKTTALPNTSAPATFDKSNKNHLKFLLAFLEKKGNPRMMNELIKRMEGKPALTGTVEAEYAVINPDAPDKEPEDK
jgi:Sec-independent protein translocase protein TatA